MGYYPHFILAMRSSRGFASTAVNLSPCSDSLSLRLRARGAPSGRPYGHGPLRACRRVVSGSLSSPCRGSSHLSLALLGSLSVAREYLALRDGPRGFKPSFTCTVLLRYRLV